MHVAFDIGNVLVRWLPDVFLDTLIDFIDDENPVLFLEAFQSIHDLGLLTLRHSLKMWYPFLTPDCLNTLCLAWLNTLEPNEMMLNYLENLKSEGIKVALLSNIGFEHADWLKTNIPILFNDTVEHLSFEVGARKPTKAYYQSFLMDYPEWLGAIYVDDREDNLKVGKKYSFKTFHFDLEQVLKLPLSKQKIELDKIKSYIFDRKYDVPLV